MKRSAIKYLIVAFVFLSWSLLAQQQPQGQGQQQPQGQPGQGQPAPGAAGEQPQGQNFLEAQLLDNFEESEDWRARATCPLGETTTMKMVQRGEMVAADDANMKPLPGEACNVNDSSCQDHPNYILGVKTFFNDRGFDRVELSPPQEYVIKGKARQFSVWVLGRRFRHMLSIKLRDYRGNIHTLPIGRLDFFGWRRMTVTVPGWLPQSTRYSLLDKNLHFVSLFVTSDSHEVPGTFYFYVDNLKVLVDRGEQNYPGSEIKDNW